MLEPPDICAWPSSFARTRYTANGANQRSTTPNRTMSVSRMFHHFSFLLAKNGTRPLFPMRSASSARKKMRKTLSRKAQTGHSGWSVSPAIARVFKLMTPPMKAWNAFPSTRRLRDASDLRDSLVLSIADCNAFWPSSGLS